MAARLPLIVSQPARRDASAVDLIESIVAGALLVPKLDANLVGDIASIAPGSTDHLCLQGHTRDVILASYLDLSGAASAWERLGQAGRFIDCSLPAPQVRMAALAAGDQRRIFYFQLKPQTRVANLLDRCQELVDSQSASLVSIKLGGKDLAPRSSHAGPGERNNGALHSAPVGPAASLPTSEDLAGDKDQRDWSKLDKLVDELDALDL